MAIWDKIWFPINSKYYYEKRDILRKKQKEENVYSIPTPIVPDKIKTPIVDLDKWLPSKRPKEYQKSKNVPLKEELKRTWKSHKMPKKEKDMRTKTLVKTKQVIQNEKGIDLRVGVTKPGAMKAKQKRSGVTAHRMDRRKIGGK